MERQDVINSLKELALEKGQVPTYYSVIEWIEDTDYHSEFEILVDEAGEQLEKAGYKLLWNFCQKDDAGCVRFYIVDDSGEG